jgi:hypothetical protein
VVSGEADQARIAPVGRQDDEVDAWLRRSEASRQAAAAAQALPPDRPGRQATAIGVGLVAALGFLVTLWSPGLILLDPGVSGGYETAWRTVGIDAPGFSHHGWFDLVLILPLLVLSVDDLRRLASGAHARWGRQRQVLAGCLFGLMVTLAVSLDGFSWTPIVMPAAVIALVLSVGLVVAEAARVRPSGGRLAAIGGVVVVAAMALFMLLTNDAPSHRMRCEDTYVAGFATDSCLHSSRSALVNGLRIDVLLWAVGFGLLAVGLWRLRRVVAAFVAIVLLVAFTGAAATAEVAATRDWCTDAPVVRVYTRTATCEMTKA